MELLGFTDDTQRFVYLSDRGHFENLGVYEMLRRRCRTIVAIDAGCDPDIVRRQMVYSPVANIGDTWCSEERADERGSFL
jgi:hypothetical protein